MCELNIRARSSRPLSLRRLRSDGSRAYSDPCNRRFSSFQDAASVRIQQTASQEQSTVLWLGLHHDSDRSHHRHSARTVCPGSSGASTNRTHSLGPLGSIVVGFGTIAVGVLVAWAALRQARTATRQAQIATQVAEIANRQAEIASQRHEAQTKADQQRRITESFSKATEQLASGL